MSEKAGGCYTLKGGLKRLLKCCEREVQERITDAACSVSDLAMHATMLVKLYVLHCFETGHAIPKITYDLMRHALKVVGGQRLPAEAVQTDAEPSQTGEPEKRKRNLASEEQRRKLSAFYDAAFRDLRPDGYALPSYMYLSDAIGYTAGELVTNVEVNIKQHYVDFVTAYVRSAFQTEQELQGMIAQLDDDAYARAILMDKVAHDLLNVGDERLQSPETLHAWIQERRGVVRPAKAQFKKNCIAYDLQCDPQDYLLPMLRMAKYREDHGGGRLNHTLPLHTNAVPMHITLDTKTLVQMFFDLAPSPAKRIFDGLGVANKSALAASFVEHKDAIWSALFRTNRRIFRDTKDHVFNQDGRRIVLRRAHAARSCQQGGSQKAQARGGETELL
jgi:hypothetical protein